MYRTDGGRKHKRRAPAFLRMKLRVNGTRPAVRASGGRGSETLARSWTAVARQYYSNTPPAFGKGQSSPFTKEAPAVRRERKRDYTQGLEGYLSARFHYSTSRQKRGDAGTIRKLSSSPCLPAAKCLHVSPFVWVSCTCSVTSVARKVLFVNWGKCVFL